MEGVPSDDELEQAAMDILLALPDVKTFALLDLRAALGVPLLCLECLNLPASCCCDCQAARGPMQTVAQMRVSSVCTL